MYETFSRAFSTHIECRGAKAPWAATAMKHAATEFLLKVYNEFEKGGTEIEMCIHQHQVVQGLWWVWSWQSYYTTICFTFEDFLADPNVIHFVSIFQPLHFLPSGNTSKAI